jgi:hypothetical protein
MASFLEASGRNHINLHLWRLQAESDLEWSNASDQESERPNTVTELGYRYPQRPAAEFKVKTWNEGV